MSKNNQAAVNTLPDGQTATNNLLGSVYQQVFFNKCAAAGYGFRNEEEASWMLKQAGKLKMAEQRMGVGKQASDALNPLYARADQALDSWMNQNGFQNHAQEQALAIKQAAADFASDPTIYNSVLAVRAAEAEQIQAQLAALQG